MGLVLAGLLTVALILIVLWLVSLVGSVRLDRLRVQQAALDQARKAEQAAREARLYQNGTLLHCMGCDATFPGPLPDIGCPHCHLGALVVTEDEYLAQQRRVNSSD